MKIHFISALMFSICSLFLFCGCDEFKQTPPPPTNGFVNFYTTNAARLSACSNSISITIKETGFAAIIGTRTITNLNGPIQNCNSSSSTSIELRPGDYTATGPVCAGAGGSSFSLIAGECVNIEF